VTTKISKSEDPMNVASVVCPEKPRPNCVLSMSAAIGQIGNINQGGLDVDVKILDAKQAYGVTRYLVTPMSGTGEVWVSANRVRFA
jgi:hypothetical protein